MFKALTVALLSVITETKILNASDDKCIDSTHRINSLPYFNSESGLFPCMDAGTFKSNDSGTHNMFYWMFRNSKENAPVTIWLNGGPGSSSMFSNFLMNGPMRIERKGDGDDDFTVNMTEQGSWADETNLVFVDQPIDSGFSWSSDGSITESVR